MKSEYEFDILDVDGITDFTKQIKGLAKALDDEELMQFIGNKCMLELSRISNEKLGGFSESDMFSTEVDKYRSNHQLDVKVNELTISNDTMADLSHVSKKTLANYPDGFSIAKAIEFGTGILGTPNDEFDWETQANPNRNYDKGWYYEKDGHLYWSKGFAGKFIYSELKKVVEEKAKDWINEYIKSKLD